MKQKERWIVIGCMIVLIAAAGFAGFFYGKSTEAEYYHAKENLNILLNLSELDGLGKIDGTIYVTGHKSPDSDTVGSSIAYAALLQKLGYDAVPVVLGKINAESKYILQAAGLETPELLEDASGLNMILVDHSEYAQSADGLKNAHIISIIDHHGDGSVTTGNQLIYDARPLGSAATIIWIRYHNYGVEPDKKTALVMMGAIMSDTDNLKSDATTFADREALKTLCALADVSDPDSFYQEMSKSKYVYDGMTDEEIFFSDYKEYECGDMKYSIGCINAYDEESAKKMVERMKITVPASLTTTGMDMSFAQISIYHDDLSITYIVPSGADAGDVIDAAFGDAAVYDGTSYRIEPSISRKRDLVPAINDVLEDHPRE